MIFLLRLGCQGANQVTTWRKGTPGRENGECKVPKVGTSLTRVKRRRKAWVARDLALRSGWQERKSEKQRRQTTKSVVGQEEIELDLVSESSHDMVQPDELAHNAPCRDKQVTKRLPCFRVQRLKGWESTLASHTLKFAGVSLTAKRGGSEGHAQVHSRTATLQTFQAGRHSGTISLCGFPTGM